MYFCDVRTRNPRRIFYASDVHVKANVYSLVCCLINMMYVTMHNAADMATEKLANLARFVCIFMQFAVIEQNTAIIHGATDL